MNIILRILLTIYAFCITFASFIVVLIPFRQEILDKLNSYLSETVLTSRPASAMMVVVGLIFFALSLTFLLSGIGNNKDKRVVSKYTNIGEIKISLDSIESIALAASRKLIGIRETKTYVVRTADEGVIITVKVVVLPDTNIPALSEDIQAKVKSSVEESAGIKVNNVRVLVEDIYTGSKSRVD